MNTQKTETDTKPFKNLNPRSAPAKGAKIMTQTTQTLKQAAAKFNYFTAEDMPAKYQRDPQQWQFIQDCRKEEAEIPDFLQNMPGLEIGVFYEARTQDAGTERELHYIENQKYILAKHSSFDKVLMLRKGWRDNKFDFYIAYPELNKYNTIDNSKRARTLSSIPEPNRIGVFTEKKVLAWIEYCRQAAAALDDLKDGLNMKNEEVKKQIREYCDRMKEAGATIRSSNDEKTYWIETDLFYITLSHDTGTGYLGTRTDYRGGIAEAMKITETLTKTAAALL